MTEWKDIITKFGYIGKDRQTLVSYFEKQIYIGKEAKLHRKTLEGILIDLKQGNKTKANFRLLSKKGMSDYVRRGKWSRFDLITKQVLETIELRGRKDWFHNFKIQNPEQNNVFELDFFLPDYCLDIENDGDIYHQIGDADIKDLRRDEWLKRIGIRTLRLVSKDFPLSRDSGKIIREKVDKLKEKIQKELTVGNGGSKIRLVLKAKNIKSNREIEAMDDIGAVRGKRIPRSIFNAMIGDLAERVLEKIERLY